MRCDVTCRQCIFAICHMTKYIRLKWLNLQDFGRQLLQRRPQHRDNGDIVLSTFKGYTHSNQITARWENYTDAFKSNGGLFPAFHYITSYDGFGFQITGVFIRTGKWQCC